MIKLRTMSELISSEEHGAILVKYPAVYRVYLRDGSNWVEQNNFAISDTPNIRGEGIGWARLPK